jgi:hypothetical protein
MWLVLLRFRRCSQFAQGGGFTKNIKQTAKNPPLHIWRTLFKAWP